MSVCAPSLLISGSLAGCSPSYKQQNKYTLNHCAHIHIHIHTHSHTHSQAHIQLPLLYCNLVYLPSCYRTLCILYIVILLLLSPLYDVCPIFCGCYYNFLWPLGDNKRFYSILFLHFLSLFLHCVSFWSLLLSDCLLVSCFSLLSFPLAGVLCVGSCNLSFSVRLFSVMFVLWLLLCCAMGLRNSFSLKVLLSGNPVLKSGLYR